MFRKLISQLLIVSVLLSFTACTGFSKELSERLIVSVAGIDFDGEKYTISAACLSTAGSEPEQKSFNAEHIENKVESLNEAFFGLYEKTNKSLFWGQATAVILSVDTIRERLSEIEQFMSENEAFRMNIQLLVYNGEAKKAVKMKTIDSVTIGNDLEQLFTNMPSNINLSSKLYELSSNSSNGGYSGFLPILQAKENQERVSETKDKEETYKISVEELLVISKNKTLGAVSVKDSVWTLLLMNKVEKIESSFLKELELDGIVLDSTRTSVSFEKSAVFIEVYSTIYAKNSNSDNDEIKNRISNAVLERVRESYNYFQRELAVDVLNISSLFRQNGIEDTNFSAIPACFSVRVNLIS